MPGKLVPSYPSSLIETCDLDTLTVFAGDHARACIMHIEQWLGVQLPNASFDFKLRGKAAGQLRYNRLGRNLDPVLRFNRSLLEKNRVAFFDEVIPHEVAHLAAYGHFGRQIKPHGREWCFIMGEGFGLPAKVTHNFEVPQRPRRRFAYACACPGKAHHLSAIRHNRILRGQSRYLCMECNAELTGAQCEGRVEVQA